MDGGALGSFQEVGYVAGAHIVGGLAVDRDDDVSGANAGAISGRARKGRNDDDFVVTRPDRHADAVILAALILAQKGVRLGIKKVRVRIEHMQHAGNGAVINGFVGVHRLGIVLLHQAVHVGELAQAVTNVGIAAGSCSRVDLLSEDHAEESAGDKDESYKEECATRTTGHLLVSFGSGVENDPATASERSIT